MSFYFSDIGGSTFLVQAYEDDGDDVGVERRRIVLGWRLCLCGKGAQDA